MWTTDSDFGWNQYFCLENIYKSTKIKEMGANLLMHPMYNKKIYFQALKLVMTVQISDL